MRRFKAQGLGLPDYQFLEKLSSPTITSRKQWPCSVVKKIQLPKSHIASSVPLKLLDK